MKAWGFSQDSSDKDASRPNRTNGLATLMDGVMPSPSIRTGMAPRERHPSSAKQGQQTFLLNSLHSSHSIKKDHSAEKMVDNKTFNSQLRFKEGEPGPCKNIFSAKQLRQAHSPPVVAKASLHHNVFFTEAKAKLFSKKLKETISSRVQQDKKTERKSLAQDNICSPIKARVTSGSPKKCLQPAIASQLSRCARMKERPSSTKPTYFKQLSPRMEQDLATLDGLERY